MVAKLEPRRPLVRGDASRLVELVLPASLALAAFLIRVSVGPLAIDDAYITFRYARNLAEGLGFVYNAGERVLGTTTPLWTLLLAVVYDLWQADLPWAALIASALADSGSVWLLWLIGRRLGFDRAWTALLAALFAISPYSVAHAASGMESSAFTLLILASAWSYAAGWRWLTGLMAALATLTRPEGVVVAALIVGGRLSTRRRLSWGEVLALVAPLLPWLVYATWYFGSPLPQSVVAKASVYESSLARNAIWVTNQLGRPGLNGLWVPLSEPRVLLGIVLSFPIVLLTALHWRRAARYLRGRPELLPLAGFAPALIALYVLAGLKGVQMFPWYLVPFVPFYLIAIVAAIRTIGIRVGRLGFSVGASLLFIWTTLGMNLGYNPSQTAFTPLGVVMATENAYHEASKLLGPQLRDDAVIAVPDIGVIGYVTNARILDTVGLVSPEVTRYYASSSGLTNNQIPPELLLAERPDFLVTRDIWLSPQLLESDWFRRDYRLLASFDASHSESTAWACRTVDVYGRTGAR